MTGNLNAHAVARYAVEALHAAQRVEELAEAVLRVAALEPKVIVEIGCDAGGTLYCWRRLGADVYGVTLADNSRPTGGSGYPLDPHGARVHIGNSHAPAALAWLVDRLAGRPVDALHIDGDHSYEGVGADFDTYAPLVRPGGLVLLHDVANRDPAVEVPRWWADRFPRGEVIALRAPRQPYGFGVVRIEEPT